MNRSSTIIKALILVLLVFILTGCAQSQEAAPESQTRLLVNSPLNYAVRYPPGYDLFMYTETGLAIVKGSLLTSGQARVDINVMPTTKLTVETLVVELLSSYPGNKITRTALTIDGEPAVLLDGIPGQEINRIVFVKHLDTMFKLNFVPADPQAGDAYKEMETLYKTVIESLDFEPQP